jgi:UDPglucose 6-dehydrogenase
VVFVAVGTPSREDGGADLSAVDAVAHAVVEHAVREMVIVLKSTVPVGTNRRVRALVAGSRFPMHIVSNPEFLKEGDAVSDFLHPDRIVLGCEADDEYARTIMHRLYHPVTLSGDRIHFMSPTSAELTKYVANTMLAMRIAFMNEVALLCDAVDADIHAVRMAVGADDRIGAKFLHAGPGYGGSCFPKDVKALSHTGHEHDVPLTLAVATHAANERQKMVLAKRLRRRLGERLDGLRVAIWGLSFKPRTDDIRESPALRLIDGILDAGGEVHAHDPAAVERARAFYGDRITLHDDHYAAADGADALVLVTEWRPYQHPNFDRLRAIMRRPILIDGRNIWSTYRLDREGFEYEGIGTGPGR